MSLANGAQPVPLAGDSHLPRSRRSAIRVVITGKGGVGKTTLTALLALLSAREGEKVLAVDGDPQKNLAVTIGVPGADAERIVPVSQCPEYLREKTGAGPDIFPGGLLALNPDVSDVVARFSVRVSDNLRLLVMGGVRQAGSGCLCPEYTLLAAILRHTQFLPEEMILLDTPAGLEHFGRAVADGFTCAVVVADPSYNALSVARESAALARQLGIGHIILVVNRVTGEIDLKEIRKKMPGNMEFSRIVLLPFDPEIMRKEPVVSPLLSSDSPFMRAVRALATMISDQCEVQSPQYL